MRKEIKLPTIIFFYECIHVLMKYSNHKKKANKKIGLDISYLQRNLDNNYFLLIAISIQDFFLIKGQ